MKEILKLDCSPGKSIIEAIALQLLKKMVDLNQAVASATYKDKDSSATLKMTIEIIL